MRWLSTHYCKHRCTFVSHYKCYERWTKGFPGDKIGIFDIETTGLEANYNYIVSYCIKELDGKILGRCLKQSEIYDFTFDGELIRELVKDLEKFDRIIGYFSSGFDFGFSRARAVKYGVKYPVYGQIYEDDLYFIVKHKLRLSRNSLKCVCDFLGIDAKETPITEKMKEQAMAGSQRALNLYFRHNKEDVISTEILYKRIVDFMAKKKKSI